MEIVIINSLGPMASTVIASILEKFDYLNVPVRKLYLSEYLLGKRKLDDPIMIDTLINIIKNDSQFKYKGGVGMADRDNPNNFRKLTDYHLVEKDFIALKKK